MIAAAMRRAAKPSAIGAFVRVNYRTGLLAVAGYLAYLAHCDERKHPETGQNLEPGLEAHYVGADAERPKNE